MSFDPTPFSFQPNIPLAPTPIADVMDPIIAQSEAAVKAVSKAIQYPGFVTVDEYLKLPREAETFLLKPIIPTGGACLIYGSPKLGKSYLGIQLALALTGQTPQFLGFPVVKPGKVLFLQLDTPRSTWAERFSDMITKGGLKYDEKLLLADRDSIEHFPFDILQPQHLVYLRSLVSLHTPQVVVIDTLRECHSGDEDNSTISRNLIANLVAATKPAALILISHSRKAQPDMDKSLMDDNRGSSYVTGRMDAILRLTKTRMYYAGRSIEEGDVKIRRMDNGLWEPIVDESEVILQKVLTDTTLGTLRAKARALAPLVGSSEEAAMSRIRRTLAGSSPLEMIAAAG